MAEFTQDQQDAAFRAAELAIEKARADGSDVLDLRGMASPRDGSGASLPPTDFAGLSRLPPQISSLLGLRSVTFDATQVSDLISLAALTGLQTLSLNQTPVSDLSFLAPLTKLRTLTLGETRVTDISRLAALTGLQRLSLHKTKVTDFVPLGAVTALERLFLSETQISDLSTLTRLTGLKALWLDETPVSDLSPLATLTGLEMLSLTGTQVSDLTPLVDLKDLRFLTLDRTRVTDISPLATLRGLQHLNLSNSLVRDLRPFLQVAKASVGQIESLTFADTPATRADITLQALSQLKDDKERAEKTLAYLATLPPWPEPLDRAEPPLTVEALIAAQDLAGWRFSPAGSALSLYVRDIPVDQQKSQLARMATDRCGKLMSSLGGRINSGGVRQAVHDEARTFADILARTDSSLAERSLELWGSLIALGDLLEQNDLARRDGRDPLDLLPAEARAALGTFLASAANLVRSFPEARALDDEHGGFARRGATRQVIVDLVTEALRAALVSPESARLINQVAGVSESQSRQGDKAAAVSVMGLRNLLMVTTLVGSTVGGIAGGVLEDVGGDISDHYQLGEKALDFLAGAEDKFDALLEAMPTDERARLKGALDDLRPELEQARRRDRKAPQNLKKP